MADFTIQDITELREFTGAGLLDVKNALTEAKGDKQRAIELIRIKGLKGLAKREDRETTEGLVAIKIIDEAKTSGTLIELNAETDFVVKSPKFVDLGQKVADYVALSNYDNVEDALKIKVEADDYTGDLAGFIDQNAAIFNEKIVLKNIEKIEGEAISFYLHRHSDELPPYLGALVAHNKDLDPEVGKTVAQQVAGLAPKYFSPESVPQDIIDSEKRVAEEKNQNPDKPKPAEIMEKIIAGSLNAFYKENVFLKEELVKDNSLSVEQYLDKNKAVVTQYARLAIGEPALKVVS